MCRRKRTGYQVTLRSCQPRFQNFGKREYRSSGGRKARQLVRMAQPAILAGPFLVPVHQNESEAEHRDNRHGASKQRDPTPIHTVAIIVLCTWAMQTGGQDD